jgi:predicted phosphodiesterase
MKPETRVVVMGDNHGNHADPETLKAILAFCKDFKPHHRVHLGDNWDFAALRKGVGKEDKESSWAALKEDVEAGIQWLDQYRPTHFLMGNHEHRVRDLIHNTDSITRLESLQDVDRQMRKALRNAGCRVIKDYTVNANYIDIGPVTFTHGFYHGNDAIIKTAHRFNSGPGRAVVMGHLHRAEQHNLERRGGGAVWICGCACDLSLQYAEKRPSTLRWQNSFMAFRITGEDYIGRQAHRFAGKWVMPFSE